MEKTSLPAQPALQAELPPPMAANPPPIPQTPQAPLPLRSSPTKATKPAISLEQFLGVKLFAWIGGLALFLGIVFFVKYAFERNLISPALRTAIGFA
ncbi:MAG TPA: hypothetical protein DCP71_15220, partial [Verrucomicrobiales bacterium]|nr:hypothetical protein [Verrucomicrobiales bacterium]